MRRLNGLRMVLAYLASLAWFAVTQLWETKSVLWTARRVSAKINRDYAWMELEELMEEVDAELQKYPDHRSTMQVPRFLREDHRKPQDERGHDTH